MIIGIGTDIVGIERIRRARTRLGDRFLDRFLSPAEVAYIRSLQDGAASLAARWAAKEATMKALGTGWSGGIDFSHIEVERAASGAPAIVLSGHAAERAQHLGVQKIWCSLSHSDGMAIAMVVLEG